MFVVVYVVRKKLLLYINALYFPYFFRMNDSRQNAKVFCENFFRNNSGLFRTKQGLEREAPSKLKDLFKLVWKRPQDILRSLYNQAYPSCPNSVKHVAHGVFDSNLKDSAWLKRFWENSSVLIFSRPRGDGASRLCWLDRAVLKASDLRRKINKVDSDALKTAGIKFGDIQWSVRETKGG